MWKAENQTIHSSGSDRIHKTIPHHTRENFLIAIVWEISLLLKYWRIAMYIGECFNMTFSSCNCRTLNIKKKISIITNWVSALQKFSIVSNWLSAYPKKGLNIWWMNSKLDITWGKLVKIIDFVNCSFPYSNLWRKDLSQFKTIKRQKNL